MNIITFLLDSGALNFVFEMTALYVAWRLGRTKKRHPRK